MSPIIVNLMNGDLLLKPTETKMFAGNIVKLKESCESVCWHEVKNITVDMEDVSFIDSTGIGFLIGIQKKWGRHDTPLSLINLSPSVRLVIELLNVSSTLRVI